MTYHKKCWLDYVCKQNAENAWKTQPGYNTAWVTCKNCIKLDRNANPIPTNLIELSYFKMGDEAIKKIEERNQEFIKKVPKKTNFAV